MFIGFHTRVGEQMLFAFQNHMACEKPLVDKYLNKDYYVRRNKPKNKNKCNTTRYQ